MNVFNGIGRLTKDVDLRYSQAGTAVARFSIAINRPFKNQNGEQEVDFINCIAFGKRAETIAQYVKKGHRIGITGSVQTGSYEKEGRTIYTTDINVSDFTFLESRQQPKQQQRIDNMNKNLQQNVQEIDIEESDLPF